MGTSERSYFRYWICRRKVLWMSVLSFTLLIAILGLPAMTDIERGITLHVILMVDFTLADALSVTVGVISWRCDYLGDALN